MAHTVVLMVSNWECVASDASNLVDWLGSTCCIQKVPDRKGGWTCGCAACRWGWCRGKEMSAIPVRTVCIHCHCDMVDKLVGRRRSSRQ
eukprot:2465234-Amphidinium_carterae.1